MKTIGNIVMAIFIILFCLCLLPFAVLSTLAWMIRIKSERLGRFWYNLDRTLASAAWGTSQETISSEVGRIAVGVGQPDGWTPKWGSETHFAKIIANWLNTSPSIWGVDHTKKAIAHSDALDHVDDGMEQ